MLLSAVDIRRSIDSGEITIDSFDANRLKPASYTLSLGSGLLIPRPGDVIDPDDPQVEYDEVGIGDDGYTVQPVDFS